MEVIGGPASHSLAKKIAKRLNAKYIKASIHIFADGESKITIPRSPKGKTIVVNSTYPPTDSNLIQTFSLIDEAKKYASDIVAIIPYLGYLRQDIAFLPGEVVTSKVIAESFSAVGASQIITIDAHSDIALSYFKIPTKNVSAINKLAQYCKKLNLENPLVVAADFFWSANAKKFADILSTDSIAINKQRDPNTGKLHIILPKMTDLKGRDVIIVDDMISTGMSIINATHLLKRQNCGKIYVCCSHGLLVNDAKRRIKNAGVEKIICTNTIPGANSIVDVSDLLASAALSF